MPKDSRRVRAEPLMIRVGSVKHPAVAEDAPTPETTMLLEEVLRDDNLKRAYQKVRSNKGAPGVDGMTVDELGPYLMEHGPRIKEAILTRTYAPQPVKRVDIPKAGGGGVQSLGIPVALDRYIQQAILQVLTPIFDPHFSDSSHGFHPGRSTHVEEGYRYVVDLDLEKFFNNVNQDMLMARVASRVKDKRLLKLIRRFITSGIMHGGLVEVHVKGTPQGSPLSPLLSNILLDGLDKELERRGHRFCRYADDCNIYVKSQKSADRVMESLTRFIETKLKLTVNRKKSATARPWARKFLGYSMTWHMRPRLKVAPESVRRFKDHIRELLRKGRGRSISATMQQLKPFLTGWMHYYKLAAVKGTFESLDEWLRRKLRRMLWKQWKKPRTRMKRLIQLGLDKERAHISAYNGRGPWWNAGASHMNQALPTTWFAQRGLVSLLDMHRSFNKLS